MDRQISNRVGVADGDDDDSSNLINFERGIVVLTTIGDMMMVIFCR